MSGAMSGAAGASGDTSGAGSGSVASGASSPPDAASTADACGVGQPDSGLPDPGTQGDGDRTIGPNYKRDPMLTPGAGPKGKIINFTMQGSDSQIYKGVNGNYTRPVSVYVPQQYVPGTAAPLMVTQDGMGQGLLNVALDYIDKEVLPRGIMEVKKQLNVDLTLTSDPEGRGTLGGSSGGAASFSMAWWHPDLFRRVIAYSGTFVSQVPPGAPFPHGCWVYHDVDPHFMMTTEPPMGLIVQHCERACGDKGSSNPGSCDTPLSQMACEAATGCGWNTKVNKPVRAWLESADGDLGTPGHLLDIKYGSYEYRDFNLANERMAQALKLRGYHYHYDHALNAGHVDGNVVGQTLPNHEVSCTRPKTAASPSTCFALFSRSIRIPGRELTKCCFAFALMAGTLAARSAAAVTVVACVGDSITQNTPQNLGWSDRLGLRLGANYRANNYGVSGTTLLKKGDFPYWNTPAFTQSHASGPGIVVIMLGTNDSKPQNWGPHKPEFVGDYEALIDTYSALPSHPKIFLNLCPPAGANGFGISGAVIENEMIPLIRQVAAAKGVGIIDVFSAFGGHNFDPTLYGSAGDQVHPNAVGTQRIADTVYAALEVALDGGAADGATDASAVGAMDANAADATKEASADDAAGIAPSVDAMVEAGDPGSGGPDANPSPDGAFPLGQEAGASATQPDAAAGGGALAGDSALPAPGNAAAGGGGGSGCSLSRAQPGTAPNDKPGRFLLVPVLAILVFRRRRRALAYIGNWS